MTPLLSPLAARTSRQDIGDGFCHGHRVDVCAVVLNQVVYLNTEFLLVYKGSFVRFCDVAGLNL